MKFCAPSSACQGGLHLKFLGAAVGSMRGGMGWNHQTPHKSFPHMHAACCGKEGLCVRLMQTLRLRGRRGAVGALLVEAIFCIGIRSMYYCNEKGACYEQLSIGWV